MQLDLGSASHHLRNLGFCVAGFYSVLYTPLPLSSSNSETVIMKTMWTSNNDTMYTRSRTSFKDLILAIANQNCQHFRIARLNGVVVDHPVLYCWQRVRRHFSSCFGPKGYLGNAKRIRGRLFPNWARRFVMGSEFQQSPNGIKDSISANWESGTI